MLPWRHWTGRNGVLLCPGGYSDTYAALCDFNEMPLREEIQWVSLTEVYKKKDLEKKRKRRRRVFRQNVEDVYNVDEHRRFNLLDFRHLEDR